MCSKKFSSLVVSRPFEVFLAVAAHRSYTMAGKVLGITQSAVSQQISSLQRQLGFDLFEKGQRPLKLTPEALILRAELQAQNANLKSSKKKFLQAHSEDWYRREHDLQPLFLFLSECFKRLFQSSSSIRRHK